MHFEKPFLSFLSPYLDVASASGVGGRKTSLSRRLFSPPLGVCGVCEERDKCSGLVELFDLRDIREMRGSEGRQMIYSGEQCLAEKTWIQPRRISFGAIIIRLGLQVCLVVDCSGMHGWCVWRTRRRRERKKRERQREKERERERERERKRERERERRYVRQNHYEFNRLRWVFINIEANTNWQNKQNAHLLLRITK